MSFSFSFSFGVGDNRSFFHTPTPNEKPNESLVNNCATTDRSCNLSNSRNPTMWYARRDGDSENKDQANQNIKER